jgi:hypothetical protein
MFDGSHRQDRDQYAGARCIVVDVQTMLALMVMLAILRPIVMVVMATLLIMIVVMAMMDVTVLVMLMDVKQNPRERSSRRRTGHAEGRREGKRECHRPNKGDAASACSFEARQHAILCVTFRINDPSVTLLRRKAQAWLGRSHLGWPMPHG